MEGIYPNDPRYAPNYRPLEAAHYLRVPRATLRGWLVGRTSGERRFRSVLQPPSGGNGRLALSFANLVEIHVLDALRRQHNLSLQRIRAGLATLKRMFPESRHPLAEHDLVTDSIDLFLDGVLGRDLVNLTQEGQMAMRRVLEAHLERVDRDPSGGALRLYPFTRKRVLRGAHTEEALREPKVVVIDPRVAFGRPVIVGTGIPTAVVGDRYKAGESIEALAEDYHRPPRDIEEAVRCELGVDRVA